MFSWNFSSLVLVVAASNLSGCGGQVRMARIQPPAIGKEIDGVVVYPPMLLKLTHSFTMLVDKDGKVIGTARDGTCLELRQKEELVVQPDFSQPMRVRNASGWFSAAKFAVTLNNGMLASVNVEPTQKPSDVLSATASLIKEIEAVREGACNAGPALTSVARVSVP